VIISNKKAGSLRSPFIATIYCPKIGANMRSNPTLSFITNKVCKDLVKEGWSVRMSEKMITQMVPEAESNKVNHDDAWNEIVFNVSLSGDYNHVALRFYNLDADPDVGWREVGIGYEIEVEEQSFHRVAHLVSMTPVILDAIKRSLRLWGGTMRSEWDYLWDGIDRERGQGEERVFLSDVRKQIKDKREAELARDPEIQKYYSPTNSLDCREFLVTHIFVHN
jgi:hypothetical protein